MGVRVNLMKNTFRLLVFETLSFNFQISINFCL